MINQILINQKFAQLSSHVYIKLFYLSTCACLCNKKIHKWQETAIDHIFLNVTLCRIILQKSNIFICIPVDIVYAAVGTVVSFMLYVVWQSVLKLEALIGC